MSGDQRPPVRQWAERLFPERHIYLRSRGETRGYVLSTRKQITLAAAITGLAVWVILASASTLFAVVVKGSSDQEVAEVTSRYERADAELRARYETALARLSQSSGSVDELARNIERRHAALTRVMTQFRGVAGAEQALAPETIPDDKSRPAIERVLAVRADQERLIGKAETFAHSRAERLRLAFRLAGLDPGAYSGSATPAALGVGGPLVGADDPKALATILDVDEEFAQRIQNASRDLGAMRSLADAADRIPLSHPTSLDVPQTSGFGVRMDPFTGRPALHTGLDFAGQYMTPIHATAPGIVSFVGVRTGYGNTVEIDHGGGFKTRYAHLQSYSVRVGERVAVGERIGAMGSTGRSTGVHLHYEVWVNGRPENPIRFLKAGDYVQQN
jgi:murein DD-endopeptidase MepM/ murein hydrolase activator NlpD